MNAKHPQPVAQAVLTVRSANRFYMNNANLLAGLTNANSAWA